MTRRPVYYRKQGERNTSMTKRANTREAAAAADVRPDTRAQLIEAGTQIMLEKGYNNTGIAEVLQIVGVPKGSFYYYFNSKEDFGLQIIHAFDEERTRTLEHFLGNKSKSPVQRLKAWCEERRVDL